jgi:transcriptional regulator with XRE-family HTH domain
LGRHRLKYHPYANRGERIFGLYGEDLRATQRWEMLHKTGYTLMLGRRLKRIREGRHLTQQHVADRTRKPRGNGFYSQGLLSRIEAGYANAPLYAYIDFADFYELDPARVMGPEDAEKPVDEAEMALIKFLRRVGISVDEAIARLTRG